MSMDLPGVAPLAATRVAALLRCNGNAMIADNLARVHERIASACARAGRPVQSVTLLVVGKSQDAAALRETFAAGERRFGENYVQEALDKIGQLADLVERFLHVVLAETTLAGGECLAQRGGVLALAHDKQRDALHGAPGAGTSACNAFVHAGEVVCDHCVTVAPQERRDPCRREPAPLPEDPWTSLNCWRFPSRTRPPTCTFPQACRR